MATSGGRLWWVLCFVAGTSCRGGVAEGSAPRPKPRDAAVGPTEARAAGTGTAQCNDGVDNDGDGLSDLDDLGCTSPDDASEGGVPSGTIEDEWTVFEPEPGARMIYVSRSVGNDRYNGLAPEPGPGGRGPKQTLAAGRALLRPGGSDWLRLRRGDVWSEALAPDAVSGKSPHAPTVYAPYGRGAEPRVTADAYLRRPGTKNVALLGIDFGAASVFGGGGSGISDLLIEGCRFARNPLGAIYFEGPRDLSLKNISVRNNVINSTGDNATYFVGVTGLRFEGNIIYRPATQSSHNHAVYITRIGNSEIHTAKNLVLMGKPGGMGIMQRAGGLSEYNVIADVGGAGIPVGECNDEGGPAVAPCLPKVPAIIRHNLIAGIRADASLGVGIFVKSEFISAGTVTDNLVSDTRRGDFQWGEGIKASNNRQLQPPYAGAPKDAPLLAAYHLNIGGKGDVEVFFQEAMERSHFHDQDRRYRAAEIIQFAERQAR